VFVATSSFIIYRTHRRHIMIDRNSNGDTGDFRKTARGLYKLYEKLNVKNNKEVFFQGVDLRQVKIEGIIYYNTHRILISVDRDSQSEMERRELRTILHPNSLE